MFVVLDTNHYSEIDRASPFGATLKGRLLDAQADAFTTIVTVQEITQGWLTEINRRDPGRDQLRAYKQFQQSIHSFADITILSFDDEAAQAFHRIQSLCPNVGTMDLKIAAIAISHSALLLSRDLKDFRKVTGLRVENWLD